TVPSPAISGRLMAADDLTRPLGLPSEPGAAARRRRRVLQAGGALAAVCALTLAGWLLLPKGPTATAVIATAAAPAAPVPAVAPERTGSTAPVAPVAGLTEITAPQDGLSDIGKVVIHDPSDPAPLHLASLPNPKLIETSRDGPLP